MDKKLLVDGEDEKEGKFKKIQKKSYPINKEKESETL